MKLKKIFLLCSTLLMSTAFFANQWDDALAVLGLTASTGASAAKSKPASEAYDDNAKMVAAGIPSDIAAAVATALYSGSASGKAEKIKMAKLKKAAKGVTTWAAVAAKLGGGAPPPPPPPPAKWANNPASYAAIAADQGWTYQEDVPTALPANVGGKSTADVSRDALVASLPKRPATPPPPPAKWANSPASYAAIAADQGWTYQEDVPTALPANVGGKSTADVSRDALVASLPKKPTTPPPGGHAGGSNPADTAKIAALESKLRDVYNAITGGATPADVVAKVQALQAAATAKAGVDAQLATAQADLATEQGKVATLQPKATALDAVIGVVADSATTANVAAKVTTLKSEAGKVAGLQGQVATEQAKVAAEQAKVAAAEAQAKFVTDLKAQLGDNAQANNQALVAKAYQQYLEAAKEFASDAATLAVAKRAAEGLSMAIESAGEIDTALAALATNKVETTEGEEELLDATAKAVYAKLAPVKGDASGGSHYRARALGRLSSKRTAQKRRARKSHRTRVKRASRRSRRSRRVAH